MFYSKPSEKEKDLLYFMQVAKKNGLPVNKLFYQYEDSFKLTGFDRVFKSKKESSIDYHQEMNAANFEK